MALSPIVFIGIGGTGGKTLRVIYKSLQDTLRGAGWTDPFPSGWQFLHVDVAAVEDGIDPEIPLSLPHQDFAGLTEPQQIYEAIDGQVNETGRDGLDEYLAWNSWRPSPPNRVEVAISGGAGQYRAVGRVALLGGLREKLVPRVKKVLEDAGKGHESLREVQRILGQTATASDGAVRVMVISSLGGGSGSGALLDVCDVVRGFRQESQEISAVVFTPDVFERNGMYDSGIAPNTFIGINELINADWVQDSGHMPLSRAVHFARAGLAPDQKGSGPDNIFLVGRSNDQVSLGGTTEIYKVFGQALSEFALNEQQQDEMKAYARTNRIQIAESSGMVHRVPFDLEDGGNTPTYTNLYALGFARLTVGRELFKEYAVQRLARAAVLRLRDRHREGVEANDSRTDDQIVEDLAIQRWGVKDGEVVDGRFLDRSGLSEIGTKENDVTHYLLPQDDFDRRFGDWASQVMDEIAGKFGTGAIDSGDVRAHIATALSNAVEAEGGDRRGSLTDDLYARAIAWRWDQSSGKASGIHHTLAELVLRETAESGIRVTLRLLEMLREYVQRAIRDLDEERAEYLSEFRSVLNDLRQQGSGPKRINYGAVEQDLVQGKAYEALSLSFYSDAAQVARELLSEIASGLIIRLEDALEDSRDLLLLDLVGSEEHPSPLDIWPRRGGKVPAHLKPSKVEFALDEVDDFPDAFDEALIGSAEGNGPDAIVEQAVSEIIVGDRLPSGSKVRDPYFYRSPWAPRDPDRLRRPREHGGKAVVEWRISLDDILERTRAWIDDHEKPIGRYANMQLREYLEEGAGAQRRRRRDRLVGQFREMLKYAMPLVKIDSERYQMAHGRSVPLVNFQLAPLNIPDWDTELLDELRDAALAVRKQPTRIDVSLTGSGTNVITVLQQPVHPVAVDNIMRPILGQWDAEHTRSTFWRYTRARPITEWVPIAPDAQDALALGWITARLLGHARLAQRLDGSPTIEVVVGAGAKTRWMATPTEGIRPITSDDALGNVFEMYALATLEVYRGASLDPLEPFTRLVDIGKTRLEAKVIPAHLLRQWVLTGEGLIAEGSPVLQDAITHLNLPAATQAERAQVLVNALEHMESLYRADIDQIEGEDVDELQSRAGLEVVHLALDAIARLRRMALGLVDASTQWGR